jgi:hypothetical protein
VDGEETPFESECSIDEAEEEAEGEIISSSCSPPPENLPSPGDLLSQQVGISIGAHRAKGPRTDIGGSFSPLPQSSRTLVYFACRECMFALVVTRITHLLGAF